MLTFISAFPFKIALCKGDKIKILGVDFFTISFLFFIIFLTSTFSKLLPLISISFFLLLELLLSLDFKTSSLSFLILLFSFLTSFSSVKSVLLFFSGFIFSTLLIISTSFFGLTFLICSF